MDTELETKKVIVVLAAGRRTVNDFILARQYGFQRKAGFSSGIIIIEVQEDFLNLRLLIEVLHKSRWGSAVLDFLLGQIHTGEGNEVVFPPISARHLFKCRIGKQVNGTLKEICEVLLHPEVKHKRTIRKRTAILDFIRFTPFDHILPDENRSDKDAF